MDERKVFGTVVDYFRMEYDDNLINAKENDTVEVISFDRLTKLFRVQSENGVQGKIPYHSLKLEKDSGDQLKNIIEK